MRLLHSTATHVGLVRDNNEDALLAKPPLYAVADGMGGHDHGEVASRIAIETLAGFPLQRPYALSLDHAFRAAHQAILADGRTNRRAGMGTTLTAALFADGYVHFGHAGDSALFLIRKGKASRLSEDQTSGHALTNCLGVSQGAFAGPQIVSLPVDPCDTFVLCTDGLTNYDANGDVIAALASRLPIAELAAALVDYALSKSGHDNVTVIAIKVMT